MIRVLFVCTGNTCRSPMAEAILRQAVDEAGLSAHMEVDSAGTAADAATPTHPETRRVLADHDIVFEGISRPFTRDDLAKFDYIVAMARRHLAAIRQGMPEEGGSAHLCLLLDFAPDVEIREVPDPYDTDRYDEVYGLIRQGVDGLLAHIRKEHDL